MIYLDNAATSYKKPLPVRAAMIKNTLVNSMNSGHGGHRLSMKGAELVERARFDVARLINAPDPSRIAFIPNATYGLNCVIGGILSDGGHAVVTAMEHNSVLRPVHRFGNYTVVKADGFGFVDETDVENAIRDDTRLIVCTHVSNVTGSIQPVARIGRIARLYGIPFLVDGSQAVGCMEVDVQAIGADAYVFSGHKGLMAPLGSGACWIREGVRVKPYITGGTGSFSKLLSHPEEMPELMQAGTVNTPAILSMGTAARYIMSIGAGNILKHDSYLAGELIRRIGKIKGVRLYGCRVSDRNGTVSFNIGAMSSSEAADILSERYNICVRGGFHCAPLAHDAIGTYGQGAVRASFGWFSDITEAEALAAAVEKIAAGKL